MKNSSENRDTISQDLVVKQQAVRVEQEEGEAAWETPGCLMEGKMTSLM